MSVHTVWSGPARRPSRLPRCQPHNNMHNLPTTNPLSPPGGKHSAGFTLLEVMVTMLILTGSLLSVAYLQTWSLKFSQESFYRSQIISLGNQMIDRMRAARIPPNWDNNYADHPTTGTCDRTDSKPENDVVCFRQDIAAALPSGDIRIDTVDEDSTLQPDSYKVTVMWSDRGLSQADTSRSDYDPGADNALDTQTECDDAGREWSAGVCLASYSWEVQIVDPVLISDPDSATITLRD